MSWFKNEAKYFTICTSGLLTRCYDVTGSLQALWLRCAGNNHRKTSPLFFVLRSYVLKKKSEILAPGWQTWMWSMLVFVVHIHAFTLRLEMGVSHQMFGGVTSPFRSGFVQTHLCVACPGTLCSCSAHGSLFYWCCRPSETSKPRRPRPSRPPLGPKEKGIKGVKSV